MEPEKTKDRNMRGHLVTSPQDPNISYISLSAKDSDLCLRGWIRLMFGHYIPLDMVKLLINFYHEAMHSLLLNGSGDVDYRTLRLFRDAEDECDSGSIHKAYFVSQIGWHRGIHQFKVRVGCLPNGSVAIGVVTNRDGFINFKPDASIRYGYAHDWAFDSPACGNSYQMYYDHSNTYSKWHYDGVFVHEKGKQVLNEKLKIDWTKEDIVGLEVDCDRQTLRFHINGETVGNVVELIGDEMGNSNESVYYPAIAFGGCNTASLEYVI